MITYDASSPLKPNILHGDDLHIWRLVLNKPADPAVLSADEIQRANRLLIAEKRQRFIAARVGLRRILSAYTNTPPYELSFTYAQHGKPTLTDYDHLHFNLAHTEDHALVAVALRHVGVDIERIRPLAAMDQMAEMSFSVREREQLATFAGDAKLAAFFRTWVRKEAFMKAQGEGFKLAHQFTIPVTHAETIIKVNDVTIQDIPLEADFCAAAAMINA